MKLHILPLLAAVLLAASAAVSCSDDPSWTDSSSTQTDKYSFLHSTRSFSFVTARPLDQYTVTLLRGTSKGAATVAVRVKADTLQASYLPDTLVHFADGSTTAELVVNACSPLKKRLSTRSNSRPTRCRPPARVASSSRSIT